MCRIPAFVIALIGIATFVTAQKLPDLACAGVSDESNTAAHITVYIYSDPRCGPCHKAIRDIGTWSQDKSVHLVALDLHGQLNINDPGPLYSQYNVEVHDATACDQKFKNFIPTLYVVESASGKVIWKQKGWLSKYLERFERKVQKHLL